MRFEPAKPVVACSLANEFRDSVNTFAARSAAIGIAGGEDPGYFACYAGGHRFESCRQLRLA